jgi:hypothetical protein
MKEEIAEWMIKHGYATGHGDTAEDLLEELEWQVAEKEREACAKVCEEGTEEPLSVTALKICLKERNRIANAIRARGEK